MFIEDVRTKVHYNAGLKDIIKCKQGYFMFTTYTSSKLKKEEEFPIILINLKTMEIVDCYRDINSGIDFLRTVYDIQEIIDNRHAKLQILD
ncbi:hypothetical protein QR721_06635 [Aciduricibacillus chroicocephali]|uniref:Uncharacterized protein n=1 Tax=Aciduricibacillus chroicocephali TaxID=3054939 RepID=A0ABY9KYD7_9BACI|nr:hypothetical protein QR721_06635 [Bacillaceae bacterium 44XB]